MVIPVNGYKNVHSVKTKQFLSDVSCLFLKNFSARLSPSMPAGTCTEVATRRALGGSALTAPHPRLPRLKDRKRGAQKISRGERTGWPESLARIPHGSSPTAPFLQKLDPKCLTIAFKFVLWQVRKSTFPYDNAETVFASEGGIFKIFEPMCLRTALEWWF